jgi:hypothetical protein
MKFTLTIDCDGAAFGEDGDPSHEIRRILKRLVVGDNGPRYDNTAGTVRDSNGNTVGAWWVIVEDDPS